MTLCEHGCGTELTTENAIRALNGTLHHLFEECRDAMRAQLDEARRELTETKEKRALELHVALELLRKAEAAEKRAVEAERRLDQAMGAFQVGADEHRAKLAEAERERDDLRMSLRVARAAIDDLMNQVAGITPPDAIARAERFRATLEWYADAESYRVPMQVEMANEDDPPTSDAQADRGQRARAALAADSAPEAGRTEPHYEAGGLYVPGSKTEKEGP